MVTHTKRVYCCLVVCMYISACRVFVYVFVSVSYSESIYNDDVTYEGFPNEDKDEDIYDDLMSIRTREQHTSQKSVSMECVTGDGEKDMCQSPVKYVNKLRTSGLFVSTLG